MRYRARLTADGLYRLGLPPVFLREVTCIIHKLGIGVSDIRAADGEYLGGCISFLDNDRPEPHMGPGIVLEGQE